MTNQPVTADDDDKLDWEARIENAHERPHGTIDVILVRQPVTVPTDEGLWRLAEKWAVVRPTTLQIHDDLADVRDRTAAANQRVMDLVRHQRQELFEAGLISEQEYSALAVEHAAVARLESYDEMKQRISELENTAAAKDAVIQKLYDINKELDDKNCSLESQLKTITFERDAARSALEILGKSIQSK